MPAVFTTTGPLLYWPGRVGGEDTVAARVASSTLVERDDDLRELREEALGLIGIGLVVLILLFLGITAVNTRLRQPALVLVLLPMIVAVAASRTRKLSLPLAAATVVVGL